jgi:hypothetical protein
VFAYLIPALSGSANALDKLPYSAEAAVSAAKAGSLGEAKQVWTPALSAPENREDAAIS